MAYTFKLTFKTPREGAFAFLDTNELLTKLSEAGIPNAQVGLGVPDKFAVSVTCEGSSEKVAIQRAVADVHRAVPLASLLSVKFHSLQSSRGKLSLNHP